LIFNSLVYARQKMILVKWSWYLSCSSGLFRQIDPQLPHPRPQRRAIEAEQLRSASGTGQDAAGFFKRLQNVLALGFFPGCWPAVPPLAGSPSSERNSATFAAISPVDEIVEEMSKHSRPPPEKLY
jgi:hypothetical protein